MSLTIMLNGESRDLGALEPGATLTALIAALGLKQDRIALEHNGEIASRSRWQSTALATGDRIELVHFVGGGADS